MNTPDLQFVLGALALAVPGLFFLAALLGSRTTPLRYATIATAVALAVSTVVAVGSAVSTGPVGRAVGVRLDLLSCVMLLLVTLIGLVIVRYSRSYLAGDSGTRRYSRWLLATLGAVTLLAIANNLLVVALAWTATSLALHQLLTFYDDRKAALVAAHKKFLVSRLADVCVWGAIALLEATVGSLDLDVIGAWAASHQTLPPSLQLAAVLFAVAACLKSAQLPFHGWLTQVMEAPTPVSALLHAGVVNIGGFLMIRLAMLMALAPAAQLLLVVVGMTTTVLATLVTMTRVSIKVALAWSTCAQMGFMLVECGLGAWHLALLHLVAHSLYKAHAFLSSGGAVEAWRAQSLSPRPQRLGIRLLAMTAIVTLALTSGAVFALRPAQGLEAATTVLALVVALSLVPMLARATAAGTSTIRIVGPQALAVIGLYAGWHWAAGHLLPVPDATAASDIGWIVVAFGFVALFVAQSMLQAHPTGRLARRLHPWLFSGFYLDERFTRLTFRIWPPRLRAGRPQAGSLRVASSET